MLSYQQDQNNYKIGVRLKKEISLLLLLLIIIFFFVGFHFVYFSATLFMYLLLLLLKRNRIITSVHISEKEEKIVFHYYYLIFLKGKEEIPFSLLQTKMSRKRYGFGSATKTLEFFRKKILVGELRTNGKWKWEEEKINKIHEKLSSLD